MPVAFLAGVLRSRLARVGVADLLVELGRGAPLRDALAHALRDPSLDLVYWLPDRSSSSCRTASSTRATTARACATTSNETASSSAR